MGAKQENGDPEDILPPLEQVIRFFDLQEKKHLQLLKWLVYAIV